jgi:ribonuclease H / adenosylcobalamin/alpha-ribazole phosphatase
VRLIAWTDGGGDSSPDTPAYIGIVVEDEETGETLWQHGGAIGNATQHVAEYVAVLTTIRYAIENEATRLLVKSDSRTVVHQINGKWRCTKPHLADYLKQVHEATEGMDFQIELIPRKENKMADKLTWLERE